MQLKSKLIIVLLFFFGNAMVLTAQEEKIHLTKEQLEALQKNEAAAVSWLEDLKTPGVKVEGDQMIFSEEALRLLNDKEYRESVFTGKEFTFEDVALSLNAKEIQKGYYQMLTIYPENKEEIVRYIYAYDNIFPTDEVLIAAFYTYGFFDPNITKLGGKKPEVYRPDLFEEYLRRAREIIAYIQYFRKEEDKGKS